MAKKSQKRVLDYALEYYSRGWSIIPIRAGTKKPAIRSWKQYQTKRPDKSQLRKWFANGDRNIAVVLGEVSNDLACRDFDTMGEYNLWTDNYPDLAKLLPTVRTANGMHVYFEADVVRIKHFADGELRGKGGYCLLPPSVHPDGAIYQWVNPLVNGNLSAIDPKLAGFIPDVTERTDENVGGLKEILVCSSIEEATQRTLPKRFRTRHKRVFAFARELYSMPEYTDADPKEFYSVFKVWLKRALPNIRTKEFEESWIDFLKGWGKIKWKIGEKPMAQIFEKTIQLEPPQVAVEKYPENTKLKVLVSLCRELQRAAGNSPFFLAARTAGKLLDISPITASRWFFLLETDNILKVVSKGKMTRTGGVATRFKYIAN